MAFFVLFLTGPYAKAQKRLDSIEQRMGLLFNTDPTATIRICDSLLQDKNTDAAHAGILKRLKGQALDFQGKYEEAGKYFAASVSALEARQPNVELGLTLIEQARLFRKLKLYPQAIDIYTKAKDNFERLHEKNHIATVLNEWGVVYEMMADYPKALDYYKKSLKLKQELNDSAGIAYAYAFISNIYLFSGKIRTAEYYGKKSIQLFRQLNNPVNLALQSTGISSLYQKKKDYDRAIRYLQYSDSIAVAVHYTDLHSVNYQHLSELFALQKNFKRAYEYLQKYAILKDSLFTISSQKAVAELSIQYQTAAKDKNLLEQKNHLARQKVFLILSLSLLIIATGGAVFIYRNKKMREAQLKKEAEYEQEILLMETRHHIQQDRLRISRDLHDNIGSYLTYLDMNIDKLMHTPIPEKSHLASLKNLTLETIAELRRTVWLINKPSVNLEEWAIKLREHYKNIPQIETLSGFENPLLPLTALQATMLFRILQEAVNNAIKYAGASQIRIAIHESASKLEASVSDNGPGFDPQSVQHGFGLDNMRHRAEEIQANPEVKSSPGEGTTISVCITLA